MSQRSAHARRGSGSEPEHPTPSHAERGRTLLQMQGSGTLATQSRRHPGYPFASVMPFALDSAGRPLLLISAMALHTQNLKADPRCSLLVSEGEGGDLGAGRVTLLGQAEQLAEAAAEAAREPYLAAHPRARHWVGYGDFAFYRLEVEQIYFVGGFGVMGWVEAEAYARAEPDPLAPHAEHILQHMAEDHADALLLLARHHHGPEVEEATMLAVDRLGFDLRLRTAGRYARRRVPFREEARTPEACRQALVAMVGEAREALEG